MLISHSWSTIHLSNPKKRTSFYNLPSPTVKKVAMGPLLVASFSRYSLGLYPGDHYMSKRVQSNCSLDINVNITNQRHLHHVSISNCLVILFGTVPYKIKFCPAITESF